MRRVNTVDVGDVFWIEINELAGHHLHFALTEAENGRLVMVHVTDWDKAHLDTTVVIRPGDHPRIRKPSVAMFGAARLFEVQFICDDVNDGRGHRVEPASAELIQKLRDGLINSEETAEEVYDYCIERFPVHPTEG